jgi:flagellar protein FliO/FliZ
MNMGSALLQMLWALLIVIGIILIIFALVRKRFGLGSGRLQQGNIKVLELRHIMPKHTLALVEVRGKVLLLGIGTGQINLLTEYPNTTAEKNDFDTLLAEQR